MRAEYKRQRNSRGMLYTKWILYNDKGKGIKSGSCKTQIQAEKRVSKIINELKMKQEISIEEGNSIIAEWLGYKRFTKTWELGKSEPPDIVLVMDNWWTIEDKDYQTPGLKFKRDWNWLLEVVKKMNQSPWWHEYNSDSLAIALVSASIGDAWEIIVKALIKYKDYAK